MVTGNGKEEPILRCSNLKKHYVNQSGFVSRVLGNKEVVKAVDGVDVTVYDGEVLGIVGESGSGKTTLGRTLSRLYRPTSGTLYYRDTDITRLSERELRTYRSELQMTFQDPHSSLNPRKTVGHILESPLKIHTDMSGSERQEAVDEMLEEVGLKPEDKSGYPHEFSGGQLQRIGIARALIIKPEVIIADEPVSALDVSIQAKIINLFMRLKEKYGFSLVIIAHDLSVIKHISDRIYVMYLGNVVEKGPTDKIFHDPCHPYTKALLESIPDVNRRNPGWGATLDGEQPSPIDLPDGCPFANRCPEYIGKECDTRKPELQVAEGNGHSSPEEQRQQAACHLLDS